ncbi:MAG: DEAD/DEAH box helicase [Firmicutes bacterium]|nr:DEAD/DEAH box helicase [Bacillota bacterium]
MVKVYFSHSGNPLLKNVSCIECNDGTIIDIINELNSKTNLVGIKSHILSDDNKILSHARLFKNICAYKQFEEFNYYESPNTIEIRQITDEVTFKDEENLLISLFQPEYLKDLLNEGLTRSKESFNYKDINGFNESKDFRPIIENIDCEIYREQIKEFKNGETTLEDLKIEKNGMPVLVINKNGFDKKRSKLLPEELVDAIREIWDLPEKEGSLRLFQEDALFFIIAKLMGLPFPYEKQLLLSMPTGGGKTEAFMIPIVSYIFKQKQFKPNDIGIRAVIIYPTNALANDQAMRFVELIYRINREIKKKLLPDARQITIGILSGDTPRDGSNLADDSLIQLCPKCGNSRFQKENDMLKCKAIVDGSICNTTLDFCRLTKNDIVNNPPDILITNPDEINFALHSPRYARIFYQKIDTIVFDEVHMYQGIFGCHISHLLRRLEEISNHKPLYIGLSATIGNAKQLAALLFNESIQNIKYVHNKDEYYTTEKTTRYRYHLLVKPAVMYKDSDDEKYVRTMSVAAAIGMFVGHLLIDSHFRKTIIFTNYRNDADDLAKYLKEREGLDIRNYFQRIINKIKRNESLDDEEVEICQFIHKWIAVIMQSSVINKDILEIGWNRGGLEKEARIRSIHSFTRNQIIEENVSAENSKTIYEKPIDLMVATKTLEVGIDIGDVTTVINSSAPFTTNEYVQRVGRAGRKKDSLAITVVNPENAIDSYFIKYFNRYVSGSDFEDAPIIISNEVIATRHILARIMDYFTKILCEDENCKNMVSINVLRFKEALKIKHNGEVLTIEDGITVTEAKRFGEKLYEEIFLKQSVDGERILDRYLKFLANEASILKISLSNIDKDYIKNIIIDKIVEINNNLQTKNERGWENSEFVTGFNAKDRTLCPTLRGSGATVDICLEGPEGNILKDIVTRQAAFNSMPPSNTSKATASSGISTFEVYDAGIETDKITENKVKRRIAYDPNCIEYFSKKFENFSSSTDPVEFLCDFNVVIPQKLKVRYFPSRFYCYKCEKGLKPPNDIIENAKGILCRTCTSKVQQLPLVYLCAHDDGCGQVIDPPIPKACINPECPDFKFFYEQYEKNNYRFNYDMVKHFKFRMTRDLEWVCKRCGAKMNFTTSSSMRSNNKNKIELLKVINDWDYDKKSPKGVAVFIKRNPEWYYGGDNNSSSYYCSKCGNSLIKTVGVPRVRTVSFSYFGKGSKILKHQKVFLAKNSNKPVGSIDFTDGYTIQLARDFLRRYTSGLRETKTMIKYFRIFEQNIFLGNYFDTHFAWIRFNTIIDEFINNKQYKCSGKCSECTLFEDIDLGEIMKPKLQIESYNMDTRTGRPRKPDPREKYCSKALSNECINLECTGCNNFKTNEFLRYIIIHTIKHGLLWALPKYAGVNIAEVRGEVYPNDREDNIDLILVDNNEGGSGAILLIEKHWDKIWNFAVEVISRTCSNQANIILPHSCKRFNSDLCPFITRDFFNYIGYIEL